MNTSLFVYGSELQGRGYATSTDLAFGWCTTVGGIVAFFGAILNFYLIKNVKTFHSAFGFFWGARTVGELGSDFVYGVYTGPITILQPTNIPPNLSIFAYHFAFVFTYIQKIFNKKLCVAVVVAICVKALMIMLLYFIFPCNHIGYSPRFHENVFIKCSADLDRDYSLIAPVLYKTCFTVACAGTGVVNLITFGKIAHIRLTSKVAYHGKEFKRDVRLFSLGVVQDVCMTVVVAAIIACNNDIDAPLIGIILSYDGLVFIYIINTLVMVLFNPECRVLLLRKAGLSNSVSSYVNNLATIHKSRAQVSEFSHGI
ncbi:hypothetical protein QR680_015521 [Steinernema hermaphroditum]|uniref:7TM GPCR serpentine receptor class x (Srx) domain-containing protein n=1 Tax=Steinernema hermaphroditum TaxID=289476 RepID=A0AA39H806_9BILA|nr:hypothetical protein QR680_015521 [Steinernema hermaphroditum]